ncbi:hypothetical protein BA195_06750 [Tenacibaculum soleae]|uniref:Uncharacterized protein n=1 Tax=Tenacibaculum soleae TaxID=447689 RepID=A0A1B9Y3K1_9FLAO|nr:hypothetical protein [Tenacibaculum soleae]OCK44370.1 hypothetical protein BA195_06750 [Tenacibaculum soleae]
MNYNKNDLNLTVKGTDKIVTNKNKSEFYNIKTGRSIKVVRNCRSFGIWSRRKFIPLSRIEFQKQIDADYSEELRNVLDQLSRLSV